MTLLTLSLLGCSWFETELPRISPQGAAAPEAPAAEVEAIPEGVPHSGDRISQGGAKAPVEPPDPDAPAAPPPREYNPIPFPIEPKEPMSVSFKGVRTSKHTKRAEVDYGSLDRPPK